MIKEFKPCTKADIEEMDRKVRELREVLEVLAGGGIPGPGYTVDDLERLCESLVRGQRNDIPRLVPGSWCVAPSIEGMDSDARVEFVFFPTYLAVAILTRALREHPELKERIPGYEKALKEGLGFSARRGLMGHGYDANTEMREAVGILEMGQVGGYLEEEPGACPELRKVLAEARECGHD